jgi:hypothetical protein
MLKKFNLVVEEILNDMKLNFRFNRSSRFLERSLNKSEKQSLNEKYNEIVKSTLSDLAGSDQKVRICYYTGNNSIRTESGLVKSVQDDIVNWVDMFNKEQATPVDFIIIDKVYDEVWEDEEKIKNKFDTQKDTLLNDISNLIQPDLKYLVEHEYIRGIDIVNGLALCSSNNTYTLAIRNNKVFEDPKVLKIFNVDTFSKEFQTAKSDSKKNGETWYYNGGTKLVLKVIINISEGPRFDVTRIKDVKFEHSFERVSGHGTTGEF